MLKYTRKDKRLRIPVGLGTNNNIDASLLFNVSDGDAKPEDLVIGKTAYSSEGYITGTLDVETEKTNSYNEGYTQGEQDGYVSGEADGFADGYAEGKEDGIEEILTEQSDADITPSSVLEGKIGYGKNNERIVGTNVGGFDFGEIGYTQEESTECNKEVKDALDYTKSLYPVDSSTSLYEKFRGNTELVYAPYIDTSITTDMRGMFYGCTNLKFVPMYDYTNVKSVSEMYKNGGCKEIDFSFDNNIENFRLLAAYNNVVEKMVINASNIKYDYAFKSAGYEGTALTSIAYQCKALKHLEILNIPGSQLENVRFFETLPALEYCKITGDLSDVPSGGLLFTFKGCNKLKTVIFPEDTSFLTETSGMFYACWALEEVPYFNTENVTSAIGMFYNTPIRTIPQYNFSKVKYCDSMFYNCQSLETLPLLNFESVMQPGTTYYNNMFYGAKNLVNVAGFTDFGKNFSASNSHHYHLLDFSSATKLTRQSCLNIFNTIYDMNLTSVTDSKIQLSYATKNLLSDEDIAIATNKGWTIS